MAVLIGQQNLLYYGFVNCRIHILICTNERTDPILMSFYWGRRSAFLIDYPVEYARIPILFFYESTKQILILKSNDTER